MRGRSDALSRYLEPILARQNYLRRGGPVPPAGRRGNAAGGRRGGGGGGGGGRRGRGGAASPRKPRRPRRHQRIRLAVPVCFCGLATTGPPLCLSWPRGLSRRKTVGLGWLYRMYHGMHRSGCRSGILADGMGLGKTVQSIALIHTLLATRCAVRGARCAMRGAQSGVGSFRGGCTSAKWHALASLPTFPGEARVAGEAGRPFAVVAEPDPLPARRGGARPPPPRRR